MAGRLNVNCETGRLEIRCNGAGVGFLVTSSQLSLHQLWDLDDPSPTLAQLFLPTRGKFDDPPLFVLQVIAFKCGGFATGTSWNHTLHGGVSFWVFLENLASEAFDDNGPIPIFPCHDRSLLRARSPPQVSFPHLEMMTFPLNGQTDEEQQEEEDANMVFNIIHKYQSKIFTLCNKDTIYLKEKAKGMSTRFNVVATLIWRCWALSHENDMQDESMLIYAVDVRSRMKPLLPESYCGNAVMAAAYASTKYSELEQGPIVKIVNKVWEGNARITDEYVRSALDFKETCNGLYHEELSITSWLRLGFEGGVYPWGKPGCTSPVRDDDIVVLFPGSDGGVNIQVPGNPNQMDKFIFLLHKYLQASPSAGVYI